MNMLRFRRMILGAAALGTVLAPLANGAVPSTYKGKNYPLGSAPKEIPGRFSFHEYDAGGPNISFEQDDMASGHWGGCFAGLRDTGALKDGDPDHPSFTMTNHWSSPSDTFYATGVVYPKGVKYPSPDTSVAANHWYIGAVHPDDWFNFTVHVARPGKYWISTIWACVEPTMSYDISFIGTQYASTKDTVTVKMVNLPGSKSYHAWWAYPDFASIKLDSGVQILHFHTRSYHVNLDFLSIAADSGKFSTAVAPARSNPVAATAPALSLDGRTIRFNLHGAGLTKIALFDGLGRQVCSVFEGKLTEGSHAAALPRHIARGGIYFLRLEQGGTASTIKATLF
jgi:hypothetical protein